MADKFDVCIIGAGPAGFAGAMRALDLGKQVCLIEGSEIGGTGVMWGALSSKTMWELAKDFDVAAKVDRGYRSAGLTVDYRAVRNTVIQAVKEKQYQMLTQLETFSPHRWPGPGSITYKRGWGAFVSPNAVAVTGGEGTVETVNADHFLICTGSTPRAFPDIPFDQTRILNSDGILNLREFPKRLVIIGAGIVGCEYATIFSNYEQTKVYLVDHQQRIIPFEDVDLSNFVSSNLRQNGVEIFHSAILRAIHKRPEHLEVILDFADGHSEVVEADAALISIGRVPNLSGLNLAAAGIAADEAGFLACDANCRVKGNLYAAGDVTRHPALVNIAETEARYAVKAMYGANIWPLKYTNMSTVMFFKPAVAAVGFNERTCRKKNIPYRVAVYSNALLSRAIAMRATSGFVKIIVSDEDNPRILGMRAAGPQASTTIMSIALLMDQEKGIRDVLKSVHPHPTMSESIQECLRVLMNKSLYKPQAFPNHIKIRTWHPVTGGAGVGG
jgi:dihydrolipoamide dehydrogenase